MFILSPIKIKHGACNNSFYDNELSVWGFLTLKLKALEWVFGHRRKSESVYWVHLKTPLTFIKEPVPFM